MIQISILQHQTQRENNSLMMHYLASRWKEEGKKVVYYNGLDRPIEGDILIPQIDLTYTPREYIDAIESFEGVVLNKKINDISKKTISKQLLQANKDYRGEVIVKPNLNYGGLPEIRLKSKPWRLYYVLKKVTGLARPKYLVFSSIKEVPKQYKDSNDYVLEKYLPERRGDLYILRQSTFLGDRVRSIEISSEKPLLKRKESFRRKIVETPLEVMEYRRTMGFDHGKFDYCFYNGEFVLFDANKTIGGSHAFAFPDMIDTIAPGIEYYIRLL